MNIVRGSKVEVVVKSGRGFKAEVVGSWYDGNGHHHFGLEILETTGYKRKPKSEWRGKELYDVVVKHVEGPNHEEMAREKAEQKLAHTLLAQKAIAMMSHAEKKQYDYACAQAEHDVLVGKGYKQGDVIEEGSFVVTVGGNVCRSHNSLRSAIHHAIGALDKGWNYDSYVTKNDKVVVASPTHPGLLEIKKEMKVYLHFENYKKN